MLGLAVIMVLGLFLFYDYKKPDCVEAQTCVPIPGTTVQYTKFDKSNEGNLGCWSFCAVSGLYGIDDTNSEGFRVDRGAACSANQTSWALYVGGDVNSAEVTCFNII